MNSAEPTIWINVTTSVNWNRPPVGIVRVESSLCKELSGLLGDRIKKCIWHNNKFVELSSFEDYHFNEAPEDNKIEKKEIPLIFPILSKRAALISISQGVLSIVPEKIRPFLNKILYALKPKVGRFIRSDAMQKIIIFRTSLRKKRKLLNFTKESISPNQEIFSSGDVLMSVGLDWDHTYYKKFYELRKKYGIKIVTCCYDLIPVLYPQYCVGNVAGIFTSYFLEIADGSDLILCISKQSEKDLKNLLENTGGAMPPTHVFSLGDNVPAGSGSDLSSEIDSICASSFILFVSTVERRKNHEVLYRAYHLLCEQGKRDELPKLVFVGMQGWGVDELLKDIELDPLTHGLIVRLNHVSDSELHFLYKSAQFCVFPSLYEGWGLPVGEALSMGKAIICSNRGSLPEVGGQCVRYVDPWNPYEWAEEIYRMIVDEEWRNECERRVIAEYNQRTWLDAATSVKNQIDKLIC